MTKPGNHSDRSPEFQSGADGLVKTLLKLSDTVVVVSDSIRDGFRIQPELLTDRIRLMDRTDQAVSFAIGLAMTGRRTSVILDSDTFHGVRTHLRKARLRQLPLTVILARRGSTDFDPVEEFGDAGCPMLVASDGQALMDLSVVANEVARLALVPGLVVAESNQSLWTYGRLDESPELDILDLGDNLKFYRNEILEGDENPAWIDTANPMASGAATNGQIEAKSRVGRSVFVDRDLPLLIDQLLENLSEKSGRDYSAVSSNSDQSTNRSLVVAGTAGGLVGRVARAKKVKKNGMSTIHVTRIRPFPVEKLRSLLSNTRTIGVLQETGTSQMDVTRFCSDVRSAMSGIDAKDRSLWKRQVGHESARAQVVPIVYPRDWIIRAADLTAIDRHLASPVIGENMAVVGLELSGDEVRLPAVEEIRQRLSRNGISFADLELRSEQESVTDSEMYVVAASRQSMWPLLEGVCRLLAAGMADRVRGSLHETSGPSTYPVIARISFDAAAAAGSVVICPQPALLRTRSAREVIPPGSLVLTFVEKVSDGKSGVYATGERVDARSEHRTLWPFWMKEKRLDIRRVQPNHDALTETEVLLGTLANSHPLLASLSAGQLASSTVFASSSANAVKDLADGVNPVSPHEFESASDRPPEGVPASTLLNDQGATLPGANLRRFWKTIGHLHQTSQLLQAPVDAFLTSQYLPASTGALFGTGLQASELPRILSERCTGCGGCWTVCPESAFVVRPFTVEGIWNAAVGTLTNTFVHLPRLSGAVIKTAHRLLKGDDLHQYMTFGDLFTEAFERVLVKANVDGEKRTAIEKERDILLNTLASIRPVRTDDWFDNRETVNAGDGTLLGVAVDPYSCTSCGLCLQSCADEAIEFVRADDLEIEFRALDELPALVGENNPCDYFERASAILTGKSAHRVFKGGGEDVANLNRTAARLFIEAQCDQSRKIRSDILEEISDLIARIDTSLQETIDKTVRINDFDQLSNQLKDAGRGLGEHLTHLFPGQSEDLTERLARLAECRTVLAREKIRLESDPSHERHAHAVVVDAVRRRNLGLAPYPSNPFAMPYYKVSAEDIADLTSGISNGLIDQYSVLSRQMRLARQTLDNVLEPGSSHQVQPEDRLWAAAMIPLLCVITDQIDFSVLRSLRNGNHIRILVLRGPDALTEANGHVDAATLAPLISNVWVSKLTVGDPVLLLSEFATSAASPGPALFEVLAPDPVRDNIQVGEVLTVSNSKVDSGEFRTFRKRPGMAIEWLSGNNGLDSDAARDAPESRAQMSEEPETGANRPEPPQDALDVLTQKLLTLSGFDTSGESLLEWLEASKKSAID